MWFRMTVSLVLIVGAAVAAALVPSYAQPDCNNVWFSLDPEIPECGSALDVSWAIYVTSSPTTVSVGSCDNQTLIKQYDNVTLIQNGCTGSSAGQCTIFATGTLSGMYVIIEKSGGCFRVCDPC